MENFVHHFEILGNQVAPVKNNFMPWLTMFIMHWSMLKRNFEQTNPCARYSIFFLL